jgi:hypothetical protein
MSDNLVRVGGVYRVEIVHSGERAAQPQTEIVSELSDLIIKNMPDVLGVEINILYEEIRQFSRNTSDKRSKEENK